MFYRQKSSIIISSNSGAHAEMRMEALSEWMNDELAIWILARIIKDILEYILCLKTISILICTPMG